MVGRTTGILCPSSAVRDVMLEGAGWSAGSEIRQKHLREAVVDSDAEVHVPMTSTVLELQRALDSLMVPCRIAAGPLS